MPGEGVTEGRDCDDSDGARVVCVDAVPACVDTTQNTPAQLMATVTGGDGNYSFLWSPDETLDNAAIADPIATLSDNTETYTVEVMDGAGNIGDDEVKVHATDPWVLGGVQDAECEAVTLLPNTLAAPHDFAQAGTQTCATTNNISPMAFTCPTVHEQARITDTMTVTDADSDGDWIGFVWGWQDPQHFYLLQWKQVFEPDWNDSGCEGVQGMSVKKFDAQDALTPQDFVCTDDTDNQVILAEPADTHDQGWIEDITYSVELAYESTQTEITITDTDTDLVVASFVIMDDSYPSGQFGTYDLSQANTCNGPWQSSCL